MIDDAPSHTIDRQLKCDHEKAVTQCFMNSTAAVLSLAKPTEEDGWLNVPVLSKSVNVLDACWITKAVRTIAPPNV